MIAHRLQLLLLLLSRVEGLKSKVVSSGDIWSDVSLLLSVVFDLVVIGLVDSLLIGTAGSKSATSPLLH